MKEVAVNYPKINFTVEKINEDMLEGLYHKFEIYRNEDACYALDGIVLKPIARYRENNLTTHQPAQLFPGLHPSWLLSFFP